MPLLSAVCLLLIGVTEPVKGPALPVRLLSRLDLRHVYTGSYWMHGFYETSFEYVSHLSVPELANAYRREYSAAPVPSQRPGAQYGASRQSGPVRQTIALWQAGLWSDADYDRRHGVHHVRLTTVRITETLVGGAPPKRWYFKAIAPAPPVPLARVPFMPSAVADSVRVVSLKNLFVGSRPPTESPYASVFWATVPGTFQSVLSQAEPWLVKNGYRKTPSGSYFRPQSGVFEIELRPAYQDRTSKTLVTMYVSEKAPKQPIVREIAKGLPNE